MGAEQGRGGLKGAEFTEKELGVKGFKTVDLLPGLVLAGGGAGPDVDFLSVDSDLRTLLLKVQIEALAETDFCFYRGPLMGKHTY